MQLLTALITLLAATPVVYAHIEYIRIAHNDVWQKPLQYIRNHTSPYTELPSSSHAAYREWTYPTYPTDASDSIRCGRGSLTWASQTDTLRVKAGDKIGFLSSDARPRDWNNKDLVQWEGCDEGRGGCRPVNSTASPVYSFYKGHDGPVSVYISRVPEDQTIESYDGSGEWIKIYTLGVEFPDQGLWAKWLATWGAKLEFKLPSQTPAGKYLLRFGQVYPGWNYGIESQLYTGCAHIEVEANPASNPLPKGVRIPEVLCQECPGMMFRSGYDNWMDILNGTLYAGGPIWDGETLKEDKIIPVIPY